MRGAEHKSPNDSAPPLDPHKDDVKVPHFSDASVAKTLRSQK